jgi:hypothetical protein
MRLFLTGMGRYEMLDNYTVQPITYEDVRPWVINRHYAHRMPCVQHAFGLYDGVILVGVATYGIPASPRLCIGLCGYEFKDRVVELNRLCCERTKNAASILVGRSLRMLPKPSIVVSFADTGQHHIGYVYQATNFIYTGLTDAGRKTPRADRIKNSGKHGRHQGRSHGVVDKTIKLIYRSPKHRYVYFVGSKKQKKKMLNMLAYDVLPYPKGETKRYDDSAEFFKQVKLF